MGSSVYDIFTTAETVNDPEASDLEKVASVAETAYDLTPSGKATKAGKACVAGAVGLLERILTQA